jgi:hypothetical protein
MYMPLPTKAKEMHNYRTLFKLLHLHVSVYMTILRALKEYVSVVKCEVQYICIYISMMWVHSIILWPKT